MSRIIRSYVLISTVTVAAACASSFGARHLTAGALLEEGPITAVASLAPVRPISAAGLELTKTSEGWRARLYLDAAKFCTIGYGHLVKKAPCDGSEPANFRRGLTLPEGEVLLVTDISTAQRAVADAVTVSLSDSQYSALVDFTFNVGSKNFATSTLLEVINRNEWNRIPSELRRWVFAGGEPWPGLKTRREREIALFFEGMAIPAGDAAAGSALSPIDIRVGERRGK